MLEALIVVLVVLWLLGYFGRGRIYARGPALSTGGLTANWVHILLLLVLVLVVVRLVS